MKGIERGGRGRERGRERCCSVRASYGTEQLCESSRACSSAVQIELPGKTGVLCVGAAPSNTTVKEPNQLIQTTALPVCCVASHCWCQTVFFCCVPTTYSIQPVISRLIPTVLPPSSPSPCHPLISSTRSQCSLSPSTFPPARSSRCPAASSASRRGRSACWCCAKTRG